MRLYSGCSHRQSSVKLLQIYFYQIYRKDRCTGSINRGGVVLVAIKIIIQLEDNSNEEICVYLQKPSCKMYIFNNYIPP